MGCSISGLNALYDAATGGADVWINECRFRVLRLISEGGFTSVYLVREHQPASNAALSRRDTAHLSEDGTYIMKKVLIQSTEQLDLVREEIRVPSSFNHPDLLPLLDHAIVPVKGDWSHEAYLLFPVHLDGTLFDNANIMLSRKEFYSTADVLQIFWQWVLAVVPSWLAVGLSWPSREVMERNKAIAVEDPAWLICDDALTEVFRRLPARALAACRLVCKSWMSVLTDPDFIHEHLSRGQRKLLLFANDRGNNRSLAMLLADDNKPMYQLSRPAASRSVFVHNSCNGLLCLGDSTGAVEVLNLTTGESLMLPMSMYMAGSSQFSSCNWHCLGFCPHKWEHKVVHFYSGAHIDPFKVRCEIYTIGSGVWRQIGSFHGAPTDRGVHVNGMVYCLTKFRYIASSRINFLNLESEKFDVMRLPPRKSYGGHCSLTELEGKLCLLIVDDALEGLPRRMDILMLNSHDKQGWTPRYHFSLPWLTPSCYFTPKHSLFHDGKIWVQLSAKNLYCLDPSSSSEELTTAWPELDFSFCAHTFIESIVPLCKDYYFKKIR